MDLRLLAAVFVLSAVVAGLLLLLRDAAEDPLQARLRQLREDAARQRSASRRRPGTGPDAAADAAASPGDDGAEAHTATATSGSLRALLVAVDARLQRRGMSRGLQQRLRRAGLRLLATEFISFQVGLSVLGALGGGNRLGGHAGWLLALAGFVGPSLWLTRRIGTRQKAFEGQLPDTLTLMANSLRSGYSLLQAMEVVSREMPDPIARELGQVLREARVGIPLEDALAAITRRVPSRDLDLVVTAILIQRQVGGNLAEVLDKIGETVRDRIRLLGQIRTLTAQGRLSGWVVACLPAVLSGALYLLNPDYVRPLFTTPIGVLMLVVAVLMQAAGLGVIRRMVQLDV